MSDPSLYEKRGVSAAKTDVHEAIKNLDKGLYPKAFCKILPDVFTGSKDHCSIMHADTAGTKTSLAYMYWKETGDLSVWDGIVQDAMVMNLDDMACVGCIDQIVVSSTIGRNKNLISGEVISRLINASVQFAEKMKSWGISLHLAGGETADVGDIVRTIDVGFTTVSRIRKKDLIINNIQGGEVIIGFSSFGRAIYEKEYNSGMGSNGLSSARHDLFQKDYARKYPESVDPNSPEDVIYTGSKYLTEEIEIEGFGSIPIGKLVLSPTRTYMPLIKQFLSDKDKIDGLIHCTGGGQTKVMNFVDNVELVKDQLFEMPPLFKLIEQESSISRKEMYQVFNMGHRLELYTKEKYANTFIDIAGNLGIEARIVGRVEPSLRKQLIIKDEQGEYLY